MGEPVMSVVNYEVRGNVAVVTVDNPPVNAISADVRRGLVDAVDRAGADGAVEAIVLICAGRTFMAGADVREFGKPPVEPTLPAVITAIENADKPVVAAIHGQALGGGFEIALGCHYRIAVPEAKVGLPEVNLGLIPGAGGTQRLPRLIDTGEALRMITSGKPVGADKAKALGILDRVIPIDLSEGALAFAEGVAGSDPTERRLACHAAIHGDDVDFNAWRGDMEKRHRGFEAQPAAVNAVAAAVALPFGEGIGRERALFLERRESDQSAAMRHLFFAEREAGRIPGIGKETPIRPIDSAAVIGAGTMGGGIAMALANAGIPVTLLEVSQEALDKGLGTIRGNYEATVKKRRLDAEAVDQRLALIGSTTDYGDLADADVVVEAVFEDFTVKTDVFRKLDAVCKPGAILATNTSYLDVDAVAKVTQRPEDVVGLHFFSPAHVMKLLEVVRGAATAPEVLATAMKLSKRLGKTGVVAGVCLGFIGNRMYQCYQREAGLLLLEGVEPTRIDKALYDFGMPMGPFALADLTGIDSGVRMRRSLEPGQFEVRAFRVHERLVDMGRLGQKTGAGFYRYEEGSRTPVEDEITADLIDNIAAEEGYERRDVSDEEIVERCNLAMVNEGARLFEEGIAYRAADIDVVYANGYGFPRYLGGPMCYAQQTGLAEVLRKIEGFAERFGPRWWSPPKLLKDAAGRGTWDG